MIERSWRAVNDTAPSGPVWLPWLVRHQYLPQCHLDHSRAGLCHGLRGGADLRSDRGGPRRQNRLGHRRHDRLYGGRRRQSFDPQRPLLRAASSVHAAPRYVGDLPSCGNPEPDLRCEGIIAGAPQMKGWKFLLAAAPGKSIRLGITAWACQSGLPLLQQLFRGWTTAV